MIDIHSHILHGLDDGARSFQMSVEMVKLAAAAGTTDIVATPHADLEYKFQPDAIAERIAELRNVVGEDQIRIHRGCDFHLAYDNIQDALANPGKYTINHKNYLLVEFSDMAIFHTTTEVFERFLAAGMIPVITHPERNSLLRQRVPDLGRWVEMGCLLQVTGAAFLGNFGERAKAFSEQLMDRRMVHVVASDGHDPEHRPPVLDDVREFLEGRYGRATAERLTVTNPRAIIEGKGLPQPDLMTEHQEKKKWFQFWR